MSGVKLMCAGNQIKTSYCPASGCEKSWNGDPRTVNKKKQMHIKVCSYVRSEIEREEHLKCSNLRKITAGVERTCFVKPINGAYVMDQKEEAKQDIFNAFLFNTDLKKLTLRERNVEEKIKQRDLMEAVSKKTVSMETVSKESSSNNNNELTKK